MNNHPGSVRKIVQVGLVPIRCPECTALLCNASSGSVISISCRKCKTIIVVEATRSENVLDRPPTTPVSRVLGQKR